LPVRPASPPDHHSAAYRFGAATLVAAVAVILTALAFEFIGGYKPCPLCLQQRWAYYLAIPGLFIGLALLASGKLGAAATIFILISLAFLANAGLGIYHAGAEWGYWPGPDTCAVAQDRTAAAGNLLKNLEASRVVRCDQAPWRFLGLSFAGWNVVISFLLWITSQSAAFAAKDLRHR
jgi:disulfide bond formation protein DsbB